jgi:uncharacterized iron-regulated membrane protein
MSAFRKIIFWTHLVTGLIAGLVIAVMASTGAVLAFETEIVEWAERDAFRVAVPADPTTARLSLDEMRRRVREAQPDLRGDGITLRNDPAAAVIFSAGREGGSYVDPYTGDIHQPASTRVRGFMRVMLDWHRFLGREGQSRPVGKLINGVCNLAFFGLAVTGLYIWWPRHLTWRSVKAVALFNGKLSGKARDFNWHNVTGLWSAPVLIVLTLTAVPISFRWGGNLIYQLAGEEPPAPGGAPPSSLPAIEIKRPSPEIRPLGYDGIVAAVQKEFPQWEQINLRSGGLQRGQRPEGGAPASRPAENTGASASTRTGSRSPGEAGPQPLTVTIREAGAWPRTATTTLALNPFTGEELRRENFGSFSTGRQIRTWTRFLHTGEALGWGGQLVAGLASLGGALLVYTGFALAWRRFFGKSRGVRQNAITQPEAETSAITR